MPRNHKPTAYPVVVTASVKGFAGGVAILCAILAMVAGFGAFVLWQGSHAGFWFAAGGGAVAAALALISWNAEVTSYAVQPDSIEKTTLFARRIVLRRSVVGLRASDFSIARLRLILAEQPPLTVSARVRYKAQDWFAGLPDLDADDIAAVRNALDNDPGLGANQPERRRTMARWKRLAENTRWPWFILLGWCFFFPYPYQLAVASLAVLPLAALGLHWAFRDWIALNTLKSDPRPSVEMALYVPPIMLALRTMLDFNFLDWAVLAGVSTALAALATVFLLRAYPVFNRGAFSASCAFVVVWCFAFGVTGQADTQLDFGPPAVFRTRVTALNISHGSKSTTYEVQVAQAGAAKGDATFVVSRSFFDSLSNGDEVCVKSFRGALAIRWHALDHC